MGAGAELGLAIVLAIGSAIAVNLGYLLEQDAVSAMPPLEIRRPLHAARLLLRNPGWAKGFGTETAGFLLFVVAVALAPLALVQSIAAGGIAVLAFLVSWRSGIRLAARERVGVVLAVIGLVCLGISLAGGHAEGERNDAAVVAWLVGSALVAAVVFAAGRSRRHAAPLFGVAAGVLFAAGDVATKVAVSDGIRLAFVPALVLGYGLGTTTLQLGFQRGGALATAGLATLLTNALPIVAATVVLAEPLPTGILRIVRIVAFAAVVAGGVLLARPGHAGAQTGAEGIR